MKSICVLAGKKKGDDTDEPIFQGEYLVAVQEAKERVLRELFGDEMVDNIKEQAELQNNDAE